MRLMESADAIDHFLISVQIQILKNKAHLKAVIAFKETFVIMIIASSF